MTRPWRQGLGLVVGATLALAACLGGQEDHAEQPSVEPSGGEGQREPDAGSGAVAEGGDGGVDGGSSVDGGTSAMDGGTVVDAGDGGTASDAAISFPNLPDWTFFGPQHGGPRVVHGVSADDGGNVWVAGGAEGLFLLEPGANTFRRFTVADGLTGYSELGGVHGYDVISVRGGKAGTVYVGYKGLHGGHDDNDPPALRKSGDADVVTLTVGGIVVQHLSLDTAPDTYQASLLPAPYNRIGRDKIRDVLRMERNAATGDIWFGGNHGVALFEAKSGLIWEHEHAAINGYTKDGVYTLLSGDWYGVSLTSEGDVWMGGGHRIAKHLYASSGKGWWAPASPIDVWPDAVAQNARPEQRTDDFVQDLAATADGVWVGSISNGLAHVSTAGTRFYRSELVDKAVTALELDPRDGSLWIGHQYGGITHLVDGAFVHDDYRTFGVALINDPIPDIQNGRVEGKPCILVAFKAGAVGLHCRR